MFEDPKSGSMELTYFFSHMTHASLWGASFIHACEKCKKKNTLYNTMVNF